MRKARNFWSLQLCLRYEKVQKKLANARKARFREEFFKIKIFEFSR